ncbi:MAG: hypothetical protein Kow00127_05130 [Bacteroidales bacterium]
MNRSVIILILFFNLIASALLAQEPGFRSIHQTEQEHWSQFGDHSDKWFDDFNGYISAAPHAKKDSLVLQYRIFGYHPYWSGSKWQSYQWNRLTDVCYFSYETDPATGIPVTVHDWETIPMIDTALAHGVKVHLCITIFSGHSLFFQNPDARQTLIEQSTALVTARNGHGIHLDVEALPSSMSDEYTLFVTEFRNYLDVYAPSLELSMAAPAVNWGNKFDLPALKELTDFFMVMAYDYYWPGSSEAGPVGPLYAMTSYYDYSFSRTVNYYLNQGIDPEKIIMGLPYYAYQWPVSSAWPPASTTGNGTAYTWANIHNNGSGNYSPENHFREPNSLGGYYAFNTGSWYHCFLDDSYTYRKKYQLVRQYRLGGAGIWALGYDYGYDDLWDLIGSEMTTTTSVTAGDTLYDSGGAGWDYADNEDYTQFLISDSSEPVTLYFKEFGVESGYDSLWIYDGIDSTAPLLAALSGNQLPQPVTASGPAIRLRFHSDGATTGPGWTIVVDSLTSSLIEQQTENKLKLYPNPAKEFVTVFIDSDRKPNRTRLNIFSASGTLIDSYPAANGKITLPLNHYKPGVYILTLSGGAKTAVQRLVVLP